MINIIAIMSLITICNLIGYFEGLISNMPYPSKKLIVCKNIFKAIFFFLLLIGALCFKLK